MKYGHVTGTKQEKPGAQDWYKAIETDHIARIEGEWQAPVETYEVHIHHAEGTSQRVADGLTRRDAWQLVMGMARKGYRASVTTPGTGAGR